MVSVGGEVREGVAAGGGGVGVGRRGCDDTLAVVERAANGRRVAGSSHSRPDGTQPAVAPLCSPDRQLPAPSSLPFRVRLPACRVDHIPPRQSLERFLAGGLAGALSRTVGGPFLSSNHRCKVCSPALATLRSSCVVRGSSKGSHAANAASPHYIGSPPTLSRAA